MKNFKKAFTLVEILVSITILSVIMVSVIFVFINASSLSGKTEINRVMQENIKNVVETISEDIRVNGIKGVSIDSSDDCSFGTTGFKKGTKFCSNFTITKNNYFLAKDGSSNRVEPDECKDSDSNCYIVKNGVKLTNSYVAVEDLQFYVTNNFQVPKVTMTIIMKPASRRGVKESMIRDNRIVVQTTISERSFLKE